MVLAFSACGMHPIAAECHMGSYGRLTHCQCVSGSAFSVFEPYVRI